jgi:hypothetical protein
MEISDPVKCILSYHESDNPGTRANLAQRQGEDALAMLDKITKIYLGKD